MTTQSFSVRTAALPPQRRFSTALLALTVSASAQAADTAAPAPAQLAPIDVTERAQPGVKTDHSASPKYVQPLLDIPQTINIIPQSLLREQNDNSLREALSNVSGITFNAGEGGGGSGDNINIRGFNASTDIQVDGLRDTGQTYRSDLFNMESVEVIKGPNSVFGGAGTTGGNINLISKRPLNEDFIRADTALGSDRYRRVTLDANQTLPGSAAAWRLNLMAHGNDVPGRPRVDRKRWGIAPSMTLGAGGATQWTLSYSFQTDHNLPDYGVPARNGAPLAGRNAYFGWRNLDRENVDSHVATSDIQHRFDSGLILQNLTRYSKLERDTVISAAHINIRGLPVGYYKPAGPQAYGRDSFNTLAANQTNLRTRFELLGMTHQMVAGIELSDETYHRKTYGYGIASHYPAGGYPLARPPGHWTGPTQRKTSSKDHASLQTRALYLMDNISVSPQWDIGVGLRHDWVRGALHSMPVNGAERRLKTNDRALSGRGSLTYKPTEAGRIYLAYGNSFNPSAEWLVTTGRGVTAANQGLAPERNHSWELGSKWELIERQLAVNAALFQVTKQNARETQTDGSTTLSGKQRVRGLELGVAGKLTPQWEIYANYTYLDSKTLKFASRPGQEGRPLGNTPRHSASLWNTYTWHSGWRAGYGLRAIGKRAVSSSGGGELPGYIVHSMMVAYQVNRNLGLQLNIDNLTDKVFIERVRQNAGSDARSSAIEYGSGRSAILSASWRY
ncbi:TonB-dependent receptor [Bordetella avium]|uniref:TonB-dependent receptor n=1 Tax=Bordetella avium TaxID=521 RepID=UPI000E0AB869|nr:TonB-dependent siderophore receptor [Bordetella avium]RIQ13994.1 TonB-dependent siderophore receptor [Bordetella avium]RIQ39693.1 TonB-dependent siderophore receptor [Bordetella avium]RIQ44490.1 TonB-dependent siderophore receptor [Bordetella avium]RIQ45289.1 TonB-dependent siderophore receptor [Bordetella avium]RIQ51532.1 TonB-dependent siderophore receptor [Bordetella avium]